MFWVTYVLGTQKNRLNEGGGGNVVAMLKNTLL